MSYKKITVDLRIQVRSEDVGLWGAEKLSVTMVVDDAIRKEDIDEVAMQLQLQLVHHLKNHLGLQDLIELTLGGILKGSQADGSSGALEAFSKI